MRNREESPALCVGQVTRRHEGSSVSSGAEQPDDLEHMLATSRELRARYHSVSAEEASVALDDAIRAQARRAVGSRPRPAGSPFSTNWRVPLSIAAVMILSVSLAVTTVLQDKHLPSADPIPERRRVPAAEPQAAAPPSAAASTPPPSAAAARTEEKHDAPTQKDKASAAPPASTDRDQLERDSAKTLPRPGEQLAQAHKKEPEAFPAAPVVQAPPMASIPGPADAPAQTAAPRALSAEQERESASMGGAQALANRSRPVDQPDNPPNAASS